MKQSSYDHTFQPPAPIIELMISTPGNSSTLMIRFLIDSGADVSVLPEDTVTELRLRRVDVLHVAGFGLEITQRWLYSAVLQVPGVATARLARFLSWDDQYGIAGRDLLNLFRIILDGPRLQLTLEEP